MSVHIGSRVLSLGYVSFRQIRALASPFPPVGAVAAPCGSPAVPHLRRYYGVVRLLAILPCPLRSSLGVHVPPHAGDIFFPTAGEDGELSWVPGQSLWKPATG